MEEEGREGEGSKKRMERKIDEAVMDLEIEYSISGGCVCPKACS